MPLLPPVTRRVGVIGTHRSGKTVFLTSLINHLQRQDADRFSIGSGERPVEIRKFREIPVPADAQPFRFRHYRDALVNHGTWPEKTRDSSHYSCRFRRDDWFREVQLDLVDVPGERVADVVIAASETHAEWSDRILDHIDSDTAYRDEAGEFLSVARSTDVEEATLIEAYKLAMARFVLRFKPLVSPSVFLLDTAGSKAMHASDAEGVAAGRLSGLPAVDGDDETGEFAPMAAAARESNPELAERLAARYRGYRDRVVTPQFRNLTACDTLVVLVDVVTILAGGDGMLNDTCRIVEDLFNHFQDRTWYGRSLHSMFGGFHGLDRVVFVATKADLIAPSDRDKLKALLIEMTDPVVRNIDARHERMLCSAILSTDPAPDDAHGLIGRRVWGHESDGTLVRLDPRSDPQSFQVSQVPDSWPAAWPAGDYSFAEVYPEWPANQLHAPRQLNMNLLFEFILS